jgi:hypothetical protein
MNPQKSGENLSQIALKWRKCTSFWNAEMAFESVKVLHESILEKLKETRKCTRKAQ